MKKLLILLFIFILTLSSCTKKESTDYVSGNIESFYPIADSYIVMDKITGRVLEGKEITKRILPASTTKILTCLTVINYFDINSYITITKEMINIEGSKIYLEVNDVISVKDLLYGLMLNSGNDASIALAIGLCGNIENFVYLMNEECKRIGMINSTFENPNGLDETSKNYVTAYDMALLMKDALNNKIFRKITSTKEHVAILLNDRKLYFSNKHKLIKINDYTTGGKTGYTKKAGRTLVTSFKNNDFEVIICTFNCSNDWQTHDTLYKRTIQNFHQDNIITPYDFLKNTNKLIISNKLLFPLSNSENKQDIIPKIEINDDKYIIKYYKKNELIGEVKIYKND